MQLDADDEDIPFFKPSVMQTEPLDPKVRPTATEHEHEAGTGYDGGDGAEGDGEREGSVAATDTTAVEGAGLGFRDEDH